MKIRKLILENFEEATKEFIELSGNQAEVQQTVEKFKQLANQDAFPENQQDINFWRMRGWKQFKTAVDQASEVASASSTVDTTSGDYKDTEAKLQSLLNQNPLNHKAILPILSSSKNGRQSYIYIITASKYANKTVEVPADVLVNAAKYTESDPGIYNSMLASSVNFTKVSNNTLNILTKVSPTFLGEAYKFLSTEQQAIIATDPEIGLKFAIQNKKRAPAFEKAIGANAETAYTYCYELKLNSFPAGEDAMAKDPTYASYYAAFILKGPFPKGEKAIITDIEATTRYIINALDRKPFPAGEAIIAKYPEKAIWYANHISNKRWPKEVEEKIFRLKTDDKNTYVEKFKIKLDNTGLAELKKTDTSTNATTATANKLDTANTTATASEPANTTDNAAETAESSGSSYFVYRNNKQEGPFPASEIASKIESKEFDADIFVWKEGFTEWVEADQDDELLSMMKVDNSNGYYIAINNNAEGPMSIEDVISKLASDSITKQTLVWSPNLSGWTPISDVNDLVKKTSTAQYYAWVNSKQTDPLTLLQLIKNINSKEFTPDTKVWREGLDKWTPIQSVDELKKIINK